MLEKIWSALGGSSSSLSHVHETGTGALKSAFPVSDFAAASIASAGLALAEFISLRGGAGADVVVERRLSSLWFAKSIRPIGWALPPQWDSIAGNYRAKDGWVRLHTNAARHREACLRILGCKADPLQVQHLVEEWMAEDLQEAIVSEGGVAAKMLSAKAWRTHPQGAAVSSEPLCHRLMRNGSTLRDFGSITRPLDGLRVLDLTRILAGPVATRFLAAFGADVLRIDPPDWDEPAVLPEVTIGKRRARLDLNVQKDRDIFAELISRADVIVHGYRSDALEKLGFGETHRQSLNPDVIDVALNAYGWTGPWSARRGFDTIVQMSTGLAETEMGYSSGDQPQQLPVQALDYGTGHMMAAAVLRGLSEAITGRRSIARFSLARTAGFLQSFEKNKHPLFAPESDGDLQDRVESTSWGPARRLKAPVKVGSVSFSFDRPAGPLGTDDPNFST
jgi:hypothetical protein